MKAVKKNKQVEITSLRQQLIDQKHLTRVANLRSAYWAREVCRLRRIVDQAELEHAGHDRCLMSRILGGRS
jgi:hypothetical protein